MDIQQISQYVWAVLVILWIILPVGFQIKKKRISIVKSLMKYFHDAYELWRKIKIYQIGTALITFLSSLIFVLNIRVLHYIPLFAYLVTVAVLTVIVFIVFFALSWLLVFTPLAFGLRFYLDTADKNNIFIQVVWLFLIHVYNAYLIAYNRHFKFPTIVSLVSTICAIVVLVGFFIPKTLSPAYVREIDESHRLGTMLTNVAYWFINQQFLIFALLYDVNIMKPGSITNVGRGELFFFSFTCFTPLGSGSVGAKSPIGMMSLGFVGVVMFIFLVFVINSSVIVYSGDNRPNKENE